MQFGITSVLLILVTGAISDKVPIPRADEKCFLETNARPRVTAQCDRGPKNVWECVSSVDICAVQHPKNPGSTNDSIDEKNRYTCINLPKGYPCVRMVQCCGITRRSI